MAKLTDENKDIDFETEYSGHKCSINFNAKAFHDRSNLKNADTLEDFLSFYELYSDLDLSRLIPIKNIIPTEMKATKKLCQDCPHSSFQTYPLSSRTYHSPDCAEGISKSCPLEKSFIKGTIFKLKTVSFRKLSCTNPDCSYYGKPIPVFPDDYTTPEFHDILYQGSPSVIEVTRAKYKCPHCHKRLSVQLIPGVEIAAKYHLTARLLREIYNNCFSSPGGISLNAEKAVAEGYGLNRRKLSAYLKEDRKQLVDSYFLALSNDYLKKHRNNYFYRFSSDSFSCSTVSLAANRTICLQVYFSNSSNTVNPCKKGKTDLTLQMAFDDTYHQAADAWLCGDFTNSYSSCFLDESMLTVFAHFFSATNHLELAHSYFFFIVRLILLYGQMLDRAPDLREYMLTRELSRSLRTKEFFHPSCALSLAQDISLFAYYTKQDCLAQASNDLKDYIISNSKYYSCDFSNIEYFYEQRTPIGSSQEIRGLISLLKKDFSNLSETPAQSENWYEYYQNNVDLTIQRLCFFNEAAITSAYGSFPNDCLYNEDGTLDTCADFSGGIPVSLLAELVRKKGLFSTER